jgi:hypothetical protein
MHLHQLKLAPASIAVTGIESGEYFATNIGGFALIYRCRTLAHGVLFDDREEPVPFRPQECYTVLIDPEVNIQKLQHQCIVDRNKVIGSKVIQKNYEDLNFLSLKKEVLRST